MSDRWEVDFLDIAVGQRLNETEFIIELVHEIERLQSEQIKKTDIMLEAAKLIGQNKRWPAYGTLMADVYKEKRYLEEWYDEDD